MPDWPHIHIAINHFPVILALTGTVSAVLGLLTGRRGFWLYGCISLSLGALAAVLTYFTGGPAEHALARTWYIERAAIHAHESAALLATILLVLAGIARTVGWRRLVRYPRERSLPGWIRSAVLLTALAASGAVGRAALLGGAIVHDAPALRTGRPPAVAAPLVSPVVTPRVVP
jgi:uncharacterized membrane protein